MNRHEVTIFWTFSLLTMTRTGKTTAVRRIAVWGVSRHQKSKPPTKLFIFSKMFQHLNKKQISNLFNQKWSNLHERSRTGWIERKIKFQIFRVIVIFVHNYHNFRWIFTITRKLKIGKLIFIRLRTLRILLYQKMKTALFEGEGGGGVLHVVN